MGMSCSLKMFSTVLRILRPPFRHRASDLLPGADDDRRLSSRRLGHRFAVKWKLGGKVCDHWRCGPAGRADDSRRRQCRRASVPVDGLTPRSYRLTLPRSSSTCCVWLGHCLSLVAFAHVRPVLTPCPDGSLDNGYDPRPCPPGDSRMLHQSQVNAKTSLGSCRWRRQRRQFAASGTGAAASLQVS